MKKLITICFIVGLIIAAPQLAIANIGGGFTSGPDNGFNINFSFFNDISSTSDITSIAIDGSTGNAYTVIWGGYFNLVDPPGATTGVAGVGTSLLTLTFADSPDGFNPGEGMSLNVDPDTETNPDYGAIISEMTGVGVLFTFKDNSTWQGVFVDDPAPEAGLVLANANVVPVPGAIVLGGIGVSLVGWLRRRRTL